jgi:hypothetical protein
VGAVGVGALLQSAARRRRRGVVPPA